MSPQKADLRSLDFVIDCLFMKLFRTNNMDTARQCQQFWATVCKAVRPMLSMSVCPVCLSVSDVVLWPIGWMDQDATLHGGRPRPKPHCIRWGLSSHSANKRGHNPI